MSHPLMPTLPGPGWWGLPAGSVMKRFARAALIILLTLGLYLAPSCLTPGTAQAAGLSDLQGNWAAPEIARAIDAGYIKGYPDGRFRPNAGVTRAEFVAMAVKAFKIAASQNTGAFRDVRPSDWFSGAVQAAVESGFVSGYPDGTFRPQQAVNRQEAACMLAQALKLQQDGVLRFSDTRQIDAWAKTFVGRLVAAGILAGYPDGTFRPQKIITRAEAVVMINKALASPPSGAGAPPASSLPDEPSRGQGGVLSITTSHDQYGEKVDITVSQGGSCQLTEQKDPQRLVVTVPGVTAVRSPLEIDVAAGGLDKIVTSFPGPVPGSAEVIISFTAPVPLYYYTSPGAAGELLITVPTQITQVKASPVSDFMAITLSGSGPLRFQASRLSNPAQLVFSFTGCTLSPALRGWRQQVDAAGVDSLKFDQPQSDLVRLIADAGPEIAFTSDSSNGEQQLVLRLKKADASDNQGAPASRGSQGSSLAGKRVVLDPGHGGNDPGAIGPHGVKEKDVNLAIASKAAEFLRQQGAEVIMTRNGDTNPDLYARPDVANNASADVFVSIHANSSTKSSMGGTATYTYAPPGSSLGQQRTARLHLASLLQESLTATLGLRSCGIFENRFAVVRCANMPAALVEVAFISNPDEERLLNDPDFQEKAAAAIAAGIARFLTGG